MQLQRIYARDMINEYSVSEDNDVNKLPVIQARQIKYGSVEELDLALRSYQLPSAARRLWNQIQLSADRQDEFMLGYHFDVGIRIGDELGMSPDTNQAIFWYRRAAEKGHIIAQLNLGVLFETGHQGARERDYASAVDWYHRAALNAHQGAQFNLGRLFWSGKGVPQNLQTAFGFFKKAAKKGNHMAMTNIGAMYMSGNGVQQNAVEARRWSQLAAMKNNAVAHHNLGVMFENGMGGRADPELGALHFRQALDPTMEHPVSEMLSRDLRQSRDPLIFT